MWTILYTCYRWIDPQKQQATYERKQKNMVTWKARADSALRKTKINYVN